MKYKQDPEIKANNGKIKEKQKKKDVIKRYIYSDGTPIFFAKDYILFNEKDNEYYQGFYTYDINGNIVRLKGNVLYNRKLSQLIIQDVSFENNYPQGKCSITIRKKNNKKSKRKGLEEQLKLEGLNINGTCFETKRKFKNRHFQQININKESNIEGISLECEYNKILMAFHGNKKGTIKDREIDFNNIVGQISKKVNKQKGDIAKIKIVNCYGALNDSKGNNLLNCISNNFKKPVLVSVANPNFQTYNIRLRDKDHIEKQYTFPLDCSVDSGKLISKYLSGTLNERERIDYKNKYFNHFFIDKGKIYKIDYSFYNMIKYMSKDDIEANLQFGLADKHENVKKVLPDLYGKIGFKIIDNSGPSYNTRHITNNSITRS